MDWKKLIKNLPAKWVPIAIILIWGAFWGVGIKLGFHRKPMLTVAIIITIILLLVWIVLIIIAVRKNKQETDAKRVAESASAVTSRIKNLEEKLLFAIKALRDSKVGKDVGKADAQYAVPWYMLIGPTGSGKTSLLTKSGLDFRLRDPSANELAMGATRDCNWLFANEAVVMDTTGRYVSQTDKSLDNAEWLSLLDHLKRHRRIKPLDGLVVVMDISRIISTGEDEIEREAQGMRDRLDSIVEQLGVNLPVYLVFTKCDMVQGFADFFNNLSKEVRNQILGCSFNVQQQNNIVTAFKEEWTTICDALKSQVKVVLNPDTETRQRRGIYLFPKQLELSFGKVNHFVSTLFRSSTYLDRPALQGFYLTSSLQETSPVDLVMGDIAKNYNINFSPSTVAPSESKSFFAKDMLTKAVFPSQGFVNPTAKAQRKALSRWLIPLAIEFVVLGLIMMGIALSFTHNKNLLIRSDIVAKNSAQQIATTVIPPVIVSDLQKQINDLRSFHIFPWRGQRHKVAKAIEKRFFIEVPFKVVKDPGGKEKPKDLYNVEIYEESQPNNKVKTDRSGEAVLKAFKGNNASQVRIIVNYQEAGFGIDRARVETDKGQSELLLFEPAIMLTAGENYRKVSVSYAKLRVLMVQVYDDKKSPIPGVPVSVNDPSIPTTPLASSFSDDTGAARLEFRSKDNTGLNVDFAESGISFPSTKQLRVDPGKYDYALEEMIRTKPPVFELAIESPSDNFSTKEDTIEVKGNINAVSKNASMEGITVQIGNQLVPALAGKFSFDYPLKNGKNEIGVTVMGSTGQLLSQTMVKKGVKAVAGGAPSGGGGATTAGTGGTTTPLGTSQTAIPQVTLPTGGPTSNTNNQVSPPAKTQVAKIEITPPTIRMKPGDQKAFTAVAYDSSNNPISNPDLMWSVVGDVGQIDRSGAFTARKSGSGQVTVASGNAKDSAAITIGEAAWRIISTQNKDLKDVSFVDNSNGWAVGYPMLIAKTADGGQSWQYQIDGSSGKVTLGDGTTFGADKLKAALKSVCFIGSMGWAVGEKGIILYSPDGNKWVSQTSYITETLEGVYFVDANRGWVVGRNGTILYTTNGGAKWNKQAYKDNTAFYGVFFLDPNRGWIIGQNGTILTTTNGGSQWSIQVDPKLKSFLRDIFFISPSKGWLVGTEGLVMATTNGGNSWAVQTSKTINNLFGLRFTSENEGWVVGEGGLILRTFDGGKNWSDTRVGSQNFLGISGTATGGIWAIGSKGTIASYTF